jgi:predicted phage baseplate assembly protein
MPIRPPALDDRSFNDLVEELLSRIPAHTPEWTNPRPGDPGRTLIELFAWLGDTLLYRANLIPERQRLAFLRLLGLPLRPAQSARGIVTLSHADESATNAVSLQSLATLKGPLPFETRTEVTVLPVSAEAYYKRRLNDDESKEMIDVVAGLQRIYQLDNAVLPYVTTPIFASGAPEPDGFNLMERAVDKCLWLALLAPKAPSAQQPAVVEQARQALGNNPLGGSQLLNVGFVPTIEVPALFEEVGPRARIPHVWELTSINENGQLDYLELDVIEGSDTTQGLTRSGVLRLALPAPRLIGTPSNNVRVNLNAGVGDTPPRLDVPEKAARLVAWLRLRPATETVKPEAGAPVEPLKNFSLSWIGLNAIEIDQRQTATGRVVGVSNGAADQEFQLPGLSVESETLELQVEETGRGYITWQRIDDLGAVARDAAQARSARVFTLDSEAGVVRFGDGIRGKIPDGGQRIRIAKMRSGGGRAGNLPAGSLKEISGRDLTGKPITTLKATQPLSLTGGEDAETLEAGEKRIPDLFRHRDRAVTEDDFRRLAIETPGVDIGRVELLPRFKPHQRRSEVPGVVSVMVLPQKSLQGPPNPRPDRPIIEAVHQHLNARRPLATELYVIGCEYIALGIGVGVTIRDGFGQDTVLQAVREALRRFLWPLPPYGPDGRGWPLGRSVRDRELEVEVARVPGVSAVAGINLFERQGNDWRRLPRPEPCGPVSLKLELWQLPELLSVVVLAGEVAPEDLRRAPNPFAEESGVAVPVVPEVC